MLAEVQTIKDRRKYVVETASKDLDNMKLKRQCSQVTLRIEQLRLVWKCRYSILPSKIVKQCCRY